MSQNVFLTCQSVLVSFSWSFKPPLHLIYGHATTLLPWGPTECLYIELLNCIENVWLWLPVGYVALKILCLRSRSQNGKLFC